MINPSELVQHLRDALGPISEIDPRWALLALCFQLGNLVARAFAWRNVLAAAYPGERLSAYRVGLAYAVGAGLNGYLPARGGDAVKVALVRAQHPSTSAVTIASSCSVVLVFDTLVGISLLAIAWASGTLPMPDGPPGAFDAVIGSPPLTAAVALLIGALIYLLARYVGPRTRRVWGQMRQGVAVLRSPGRYARTVLTVQSLAWSCRIGVVYCLLSAFGIPASVPLAALVVVVGGMSTLVPVPGGAGTQQALAVFVLAAVASTSTALGYSISAQVGITLVNTTIAMLAAMLIFGRLHPLAALRDAARAATLRPAVEPVP
ncbi:MAG: flippase-like protein [Thermoleophilia bacterium]|nr:flippase-like protein [Thermoleophilia bacterium]